MINVLHYLQTPQVPPSLLQCLQYLQFLQALHDFVPVHVASVATLQRCVCANKEVETGARGVVPQDKKRQAQLKENSSFLVIIILFYQLYNKVNIYLQLSKTSDGYLQKKGIFPHCKWGNIPCIACF